MPTLARRLPDLLAVGLGGLACAQAVTAVLGAWLLPPPAVTRDAAREVAPPAVARLDADVLGERFGLIPLPTAEPPPPDAHLLGTLLSADAGWSMALLQAGARLTTVREGDSWGPYQIDQIERFRVWLRRDGHRSELAFGASPAGATPIPLQLARALGPGSFAVSRAEVSRLLAHPEELAREVFVVPTSTGFRLTRLGAGSPLASIGLQQGDEIRSIDGRPSSLETLMNLYGNLSATRQVSVEVARAGGIVRLSLQLD